MTNEIKSTFGDPGVMAVVGILVGFLVRMLKTNRIDALLRRLPFVNPVPKHWLPWLAVGLGPVLMVLDAKINGGLSTWRDALREVLEGVLAGSFAVAGHETIVEGPKRAEAYRLSLRPKAEGNPVVIIPVTPATPKEEPKE